MKTKLNLSQGNNLCMVETSTGTKVAQVFVSDEIAAPAEVAALFAAAPDLLAALIRLREEGSLREYLGDDSQVRGAKAYARAAIAKAQG